jgi:diaminopimelate epimerase
LDDKPYSEQVSFDFLKGHGTENDFVIVPDPDGEVLGAVDPALVAAVCDRRTGIGGDGLIRVIRCSSVADPTARAAAAQGVEWFMDHRNRDGSTSEVCGNGARVFARYLDDLGLIDSSVPLLVGTRAGIRQVRYENDGTITVDMGTPVLRGDTKVTVGDRTWLATHVDMGNPHAVVSVGENAAAPTLLEPPGYDEAEYPDGVNVEFVARVGPRRLAMRVFERGSGETRSCGTGACAAVAATVATDYVELARAPELPTSYQVDVAGGELSVTRRPDGRVDLTGPAEIVAVGAWLG